MNRSVILSRQLALVAYIERHPGITVDQLARHFGMKSGLVRQDIEVLDRAGFGDLLPDCTFELNMDRYLESGELELSSNLSVRSAPRLTPGEAAVLLMGLRAVASGLTDEQSSLVPGLMADILALTGEGDPGLLGLSRVIESNPTDAIWQLLQTAIRERRQVRISYVSSAGHRSSRLIDPLRLEREELAWLLHSWCHETGDQRTFRLDRIVEIDLLDSPQRHGRTPEHEHGDDCYVDLRGSARWRLGEIPARVIESEEGTIRVRFEVWDPQWMVSRLLAMSPDVVATDPGQWLHLAGGRARAAVAVWDKLPVMDGEDSGVER